MGRTMAPRSTSTTAHNYETQYSSNFYQLSQALSSKAVVLRIEAGSQEAGFLAAFCPIDQVPSMILIHNGQLKDNVVTGVEKDDFVKRILAALTGNDTHPVAAQSQVGGAGQASPASTTQAQDSSVSSQPHSPPQSNPNSEPPSVSRPSQLENDRKQEQEADQTQATEAVSQPPKAPKTARNDYAAQQRSRLAEAKKERERVMAQIEADKIARKQREKERKEAERATMSPIAMEMAMPADTRRPVRRSGPAAEANIQVRLFSGTTLRASFPATARLDKDIRAWVDDGIAEDAQQARPPPYIFKHILNPLPSKTIEVGEEAQTLGDLDMLPSATLVLVPVPGAAVNAFGAGGAGGLLNYARNAVTSLIGLISAFLGWIVAAFGSVTGSRARGADQVAQRTAADDTQAVTATATDGTNERDSGRMGKIRVRTLADGRADEAKDKPETWYNGNQVSEDDCKLTGWDANESTDKLSTQR